MQDAQEILRHFESLGDNCEFGFVQRRSGLEPGGFLRWAFTSPDALTRALETRFSGIYEYENLAPSSDDMVRDSRHGIFFHTKMRSELRDGKRAFIQAEPERRKAHAEEAPKAEYLKAKLIQQLDNAEKVFVYKVNYAVENAVMKGLHDRLLAYNPGNTLLLVGRFDKPPGTVWQADPGMLMASIDQLAPYERADDISYETWMEICRQAARICGLSKAHENAPGIGGQTLPSLRAP